MQFSDTHTVSRQDFEEFGRRIGLSPRIVKRELDFFAAEHPLAQELISRSFLSEQLQRYYRQSYNYRRTTLTSS
jgi:serine/threonine-protein kinase HipA